MQLLVTELSAGDRYAARSVGVCGQNPAKLPDRVLVSVVLDLREVAGKIKAHALALVQAGLVRLDALVKEIDVDSENLGDAIEATG